MTMIRRVTAAELFTLADQITKLANRGSVSNVTENLAEALTHVLDAAKTAAFNEALEAHRATPCAGDAAPSSGAAPSGGQES